jgi:HEAT repeat protein
VVTYFCPACWARVSGSVRVCPVCGADLARLDRDAFDTKLIRALDHPEVQTALRAARILGERRTERAVPALIARSEAGADPYLRAEIALALKRIGGREAAAALGRLAQDPSIIVRRAAAEPASKAAR